MKPFKASACKLKLSPFPDNLFRQKSFEVAKSLDAALVYRLLDDAVVGRVERACFAAVFFLKNRAFVLACKRFVVNDFDLVRECLQQAFLKMQTVFNGLAGPFRREELQRKLVEWQIYEQTT